MKLRTIRCIVACTNSNGDPALVPTSVTCLDEQVENGDHYDRAKEDVEAQGYENPCWVTDEDNAETRHLFTGELAEFIAALEVIRKGHGCPAALAADTLARFGL